MRRTMLRFCLALTVLATFGGATSSDTLDKIWGKVKDVANDVKDAAKSITDLPCMPDTCAIDTCPGNGHGMDNITCPDPSINPTNVPEECQFLQCTLFDPKCPSTKSCPGVVEAPSLEVPNRPYIGKACLARTSNYNFQVCELCAAGYADCNNATGAGDGCETNLNKSSSNCGTCGNVCPGQDDYVKNNSGPACVSGQCYVTCLSGFADCNKEAKDGCETNLNTDTHNCGACGNQCKSGEICDAHYGIRGSILPPARCTAV